MKAVKRFVRAVTTENAKLGRRVKKPIKKAVAMVRKVFKR